MNKGESIAGKLPIAAIEIKEVTVFLTYCWNILYNTTTLWADSIDAQMACQIRGGDQFSSLKQSS